jgi:hypothetical protein
MRDMKRGGGGLLVVLVCVGEVLTGEAREGEGEIAHGFVCYSCPHVLADCPSLLTNRPSKHV